MSTNLNNSLFIFSTLYNLTLAANSPDMFELKRASSPNEKAIKSLFYRVYFSWKKYLIAFEDKTQIAFKQAHENKLKAM